MHDDFGEDGPNSKSTAFLLALAWIFGFGGLHRFYLNRPVTGFLYLITWGFLGIGQLYDLIRLPHMVQEENLKHAALKALSEKRALQAMGGYRMLPPAPASVEATAAKAEATPEEFRMKLVHAAAKNGGKLSVTQGVMATGKSFEEVEAALDAMAKSGYVGIDNDAHTGMVVYTFGQLDHPGD